MRVVPPVGRVFGYFEHGLVVAGTAVGGVLGRVFLNSDSVSAQLGKCTENVQTLTAREVELRQSLRNVEEMEALLGYVRLTGTEGVAARVISRSLPAAGTVTIDKGSQDGVTVGSAVVVGDGQLLGTVIEAEAILSTVRLVHEKQSKIPAAIWGSSRTIGLVEGQSGSVLHMAFIPVDTNIADGDLVVTSGLDGGLPANIVIGLVTSVIREDTAPFLNALIEPLYDAREWTSVLVIGS